MPLISHRRQVVAQVNNALNTAMEAIAEDVKANAVRETNKLIYDRPPSPTYVRTGTLKNSIDAKYVEPEKAVYVGTNLEYAPYVELGTVHMAPRPFLKRSLTLYISEYERLLDAALRALMN